MKTSWTRRAAALAIALLGGAALAAERADWQGGAQRLGGDLFVAGGSVTVSQRVEGDLFATGGSVDLDAPVAGDMLAAGGKLRLGADVEHSVFAAGGQVSVNGKVGRNLRAVGGQVELGPKAEVAGNVSVGGGQARLAGRIGGHVQAAAGRLWIDGPVGGDVIATSGQVELGPNARIAGTLRYRSGEALRQDPAAQVAGGVELLGPLPARGASAPEAGRHAAERGAHAASGAAWVWTLGLVLLAALLLAALPGFSAGASHTLREQPGTSLLLGFVLLVCVPVAALLALVTLIGIPLGLLLIALYLALLPVGYVAAAVALGDWALQRWRAADATALRWRIGFAALALLVLALLGRAPWLGGLVAFAALLAGLGALLLQARRLWTERSAPSGVTP